MKTHVAKLFSIVIGLGKYLLNLMERLIASEVRDAIISVFSRLTPMFVLFAGKSNCNSGLCASNCVSWSISCSILHSLEPYLKVEASEHVNRRHDK